MRQILRIEAGQSLLVGTCHRPDPGAATVASRTAVLFLNFGQFDRAGPANLPVQLADRLCRLGYTVFRFDLPGLGDSPGHLPEYFETYWRFVEEGGDAEAACALIRALKRQFALSGLVVGGLCGGATTAGYAAEQLDGDVQGLLLLEPWVTLSPKPTERVREEMPVSNPASPRAGLRHRLKILCRRLEDRARASRFRPLLRAINSGMRRIVHILKRSPFPPGVNLRIIRCWQKLVADGLPMLVLSAPGPHCLLIQRDVFPPGNRKRATVLGIEQTNHIFTSGLGKQAVADEIDRWMTANFPLQPDRVPESV